MPSPVRPQIVRSVVISLRDSDRREPYFAQDFARRFTVFDAYDARIEDWRRDFDVESFVSVHGSEPTHGQAGCAISHALVIQGFARAAGHPTDLLLVAEDDGLYVDDAEDALRRVLDRPLPFDVVVLADLWSREPRAHLRRALGATSQLSFLARVIRTPHTTYRLGRFAGPPYSTGLYLITRGGARKLDEYLCSSALGQPRDLADDWARFRREAGLDVAVLRPSLAAWMDGSTTRDDSVIVAERLTTAPEGSETLHSWLRTHIAVRSRMRALALACRATVDDLRRRCGR